MSRTINTMSLALAVLTSVVAATSDANACGGGGRGRVSLGYGGGRVSVGFGGGYGHSPRYNPAPVHRQPVFQQPLAQTPVIQQPIQAFPQPAQLQQPPIQPRQAVMPAQPVQPQVRQQAAPAVTSEQSALDALAAFGGIAQPAATPAPQPATHVGTWNASVGNSQVALNLAADGSFNWIARSGGKTSSFAGRFTIANGQLSLVRNDNQQLAGSWIADNGGFRFKMAGAKDGGLLFVRG